MLLVMSKFIPLLCCLGLFVAACGDCEDRHDARSWVPVAEDALDGAQKTQRVAAFEAKDAMFKELSGALMGAIRDGGPAAAIDVCRREAPQVAMRVSKEHGVVIGRTSFRLRNAKNAPPAWAESLVADATADNAYAAGSDGTLGLLLPIRLQNACLTCHGDPAAIPDEVRSELERWYPDDQATGFAQGDLRGYFWIEVPAKNE